MTPKESTKTKVLMCQPISETDEIRPEWDWWRKTKELVGKPSTIVDFTTLKKAYPNPTKFEQSYNGIQVALKAYEAEKNGYDAFIIGCSSDMGVEECRALVNIPVVAPTEATVHLASTLGSKFSAINLQADVDYTIERAVRNAGLIDRLASIRCPPGLNVAEAISIPNRSEHEQKKLVERFTAEMSKAVHEDRAEVLFVGCIHSSGFLTMRGIYEVEGAPVIDLFAASLKMAETLVDLKRAFGTAVCKKTVYTTPFTGWEKYIPRKYMI